MDELENILLSGSVKFHQCKGWNGSRSKMTVDGNSKILFFTKWVKHGKFELSKGARLYPDMNILLHQIASDCFPDLDYNVVQINHNVRCKPHKDSKNIGDSYIFTVGSFTDGNLIVENLNKDIYKKPYLFNGYRQEHATGEFEGDRFCIIYYKLNTAISSK